ncbi:IclR family transcriptional regulator [Streptosporangium sp. 'caverna']|uniref:IclR family transcriptional regulator n=1 Tax=Streptosporangium sp. 'caverna' TaxID=2202249 RepID=UPI000D7D41E1|nr:IclR family transcriptional regulator [Streptosporangium sp. 'caverna']AWS46586.1 IclR family transcriptional regulator [Streptosporangium sp. 'caverna']
MSNEHSMSVTDKVLALLGAFSYETPALTLTELSRRTGLSMPTVHRRAAELVEWGALERGPDRRYRVGLRLWEVATLAPRGSALRNAALPFLQDLYDVTKEQHIHLSVRDHLDVVFLERLSTPNAPQADSRAGGRFGAFATGAGLVLLAHAPGDVREKYLSNPLRRYTENTVTDPARLRSLLAGVRREGYSTSDRMVGPDVHCIGAPIYGADGSVVAAVSICFRAGSQSPQTLAPSVRAAARRISHALR